MYKVDYCLMYTGYIYIEILQQCTQINIYYRNLSLFLCMESSLFVLDFLWILSIVWQVFPATVSDLHLYIKKMLTRPWTLVSCYKLQYNVTVVLSIWLLVIQSLLIKVNKICPTLVLCLSNLCIFCLRPDWVPFSIYTVVMQ